LEKENGGSIKVQYPKEIKQGEATPKARSNKTLWST